MHTLMRTLAIFLLFLAGLHGQGPDPYVLQRDLRDLAAEVLRRTEPLPVRHWKMAPVYDGLARLSQTTGDPRYLAEVLRFGDMAGWHPHDAGMGVRALPVGAVWLRIARMNPEAAYRAVPTLKRVGETRLPASEPWFFLPALAAVTSYPGAGIDPGRVESFTGSTNRGDSIAPRFLALAMALEAGRGEARVESALLPQFHSLAEHFADAWKSAGGAWNTETLIVDGERVQDLTSTAMLVLGYAIGVRQGWLSAEPYLPMILETTGAVAKTRLNLDQYRPWELGLFLGAGAEVLALTGKGGSSHSDAELLIRAENQYRQSGPPRATAMYVPRRKDDIAWENDRMAFRIYGPALRESGEDSGVDAWIKRVSYPVIEKWYRLDFAGEKSYHDDSGEGYDGYKVGPRRGCGGAGIWDGGELITSNVYHRFEIYWSGPYEAAFTAWYTYPNGIEEEKHFSIRLGGEATRVRSVFTRGGEPASGLTVAVGLTTQTGEHVAAFDGASGRLSLTDLVGDDRMETFVRWAPSLYPEAEEVVIGSGKKQEHLVLLTADAEGRVEYEFGFDLP